MNTIVMVLLASLGWLVAGILLGYVFGSAARLGREEDQPEHYAVEIQVDGREEPMRVVAFPSEDAAVAFARAAVLDYASKIAAIRVRAERVKEERYV
jgi:hypothetical protein